jgi:hypothetical protein
MATLSIAGTITPTGDIPEIAIEIDNPAGVITPFGQVTMSMVDHFIDLAGEITPGGTLVLGDPSDCIPADYSCVVPVAREFVGVDLCEQVPLVLAAVVPAPVTVPLSMGGVIIPIGVMLPPVTDCIGDEGDDFEDYVDVPALQAVWPVDNTIGGDVSWAIDTSIFAQGLSSVRVQLASGTGIGHAWRTRVLTGYTPNQPVNYVMSVKTSSLEGFQVGVQIAGQGTTLATVVGGFAALAISGLADLNGHVTVRFGILSALPAGMVYKSGLNYLSLPEVISDNWTVASITDITAGVSLTEGHTPYTSSAMTTLSVTNHSPGCCCTFRRTISGLTPSTVYSAKVWGKSLNAPWFDSQSSVKIQNQFGGGWSSNVVPSGDWNEVEARGVSDINGSLWVEFGRYGGYPFWPQFVQTFFSDFRVSVLNPSATPRSAWFDDLRFLCS